ncbi:MAG: PDZ domain-containing protein, partial [Gammaproteobacteria bacterium]
PDWTLSGTFLDAENAHAMFVDENGDELLLELDDDIQGCDLVEVLQDFAKLKCKGKIYSMQLRSSVGDIILQAEFEQSLENSETIVLSKTEVSDYINEKQKLVSEIGFLPVMEDERVVGFSLSKIKPDTKAATLGLYNGDVVTAVNGVPAADPEFMQTVQALSNAPEVSIQIDRNGQIMAYTYILD